MPPSTDSPDAAIPTVLRASDPRGRPVRWANLEAATLTRAEGEPARFHGEAIVFNTPTWIGSKRYGFWESIAPEAVARTLREDEVVLLVNHNPDLLLARTGNQTLRLTPATTGLQVDAEMADVSYARDAETLLARRDLSKMSFAFEPLAWDYTQRDDGSDEYVITDLNLYDVSVVTSPAYETTSAGLRGTALDVLCRQAGLDAHAQRRLLRNLTDAPEEVLTVMREISGSDATDRPADPDATGTTRTAPTLMARMNASRMNEQESI